MRPHRHVVLLWLLLLYAVVAAAGVYAAKDTLDQPPQPATWTNQWPIGGGYYLQMAQIVTAGQYGFLDRVSLLLDNLNATGPVTVSIQMVVGGLPSGAEIGNAMIPVSALPSYGNPQWVSANISGSTKLAMIPGTQYAIVVSSQTGTIRWYTSANYYSEYSAYMLVNQQGSGWISWLPEDAMFQAYVIPETVDQSQSQTTGAPVYLGSTPVGQTFTVGAHGILDRVSVYLVNSSINSAPISVSLRTVTSSGLPSTTEVASGTISLDAMPPPGSSGWATVYIGRLLVTPGTKYALLLSTNSFGPGWAVGSDVYSGGSWVVKNGTNWMIDASDASFQTRVIPPILNSEVASWSWGPPIARPECIDIEPVWDSCWNSGGFIARWSGILSYVSVPLEEDYGPPPPSTATINVDIMGPVVPWPPGILWYPSGPLIGSGTIPVAAIARYSGYSWYDAAIHGITGASPSGLQVIANTEYAVRPSLNQSGYVYWGINTGVGPPPGAGAHRSYILPVTSIAAEPRPAPSPVITPCANGICPEAKGGFTPADLTGGIISHFQFVERPNGSIHGVLIFNDPSPGGITLQCTTDSAGCGLTVTTFACLDTHVITVAGTYTPRKGTSTNYQLILSGISQGPGIFGLTVTGPVTSLQGGGPHAVRNQSGDYQYNLTQHGIVDVTCPAEVAAVAAGQR